MAWDMRDSVIAVFTCWTRVCCRVKGGENPCQGECASPARLVSSILEAKQRLLVTGNGLRNKGIKQWLSWLSALQPYK